MNETPLYEALVEAGVSRERARAAVDDLARAQQVVMTAKLKAELAQHAELWKAKLEAELAQMEARMTTWRAAAIIFAAIVLLKLSLIPTVLSG